MSSSSTPVASTPVVTRRVRAYFAPVDRTSSALALFDPAQQGRFSPDTPPAPWIDLGYISKFVRKSATRVQALRSGAPAATMLQSRSEIESTVTLEFSSWGKLQAALSSGSQQTNLLVTASGAPPNGSGGRAAAAVPLVIASVPESTATALNVGVSASSAFAPGSLIAVDIDYTGQTGYVGSGVSAAYVSSSAAVNGDSNFIRRVTLNVGLVTSVSNGVLQLATPLLAGTPVAGMQVSLVNGFCDREGPSFFQEWSALFVVDGAQGDRILFHYPRLQPMEGSAEAELTLAAPLTQMRLAAAFRALPVHDANDGEPVLCFRSYLPAPMRAV